MWRFDLATFFLIVCDSFCFLRSVKVVNWTIVFKFKENSIIYDLNSLQNRNIQQASSHSVVRNVGTIGRTL